MNRLGNPLPNGRYVLGNALIIRVENDSIVSRNSDTVALTLPITATVQQDEAWKVWYIIKNEEHSAILMKAPIE